eukprot:TRINITY_DN2587_c0_g1_i1.p1 TRINITY_DN2587_c0_g1~~TRINITY_DN2587_c0_g1_i1.p1  ORF type:complete len:289 (+),score=54.61 TRINITY_DN2587_c0_g1_i1:90-956(+)
MNFFKYMIILSFLIMAINCGFQYNKNILIIGSAGSGKSSFVNNLFGSKVAVSEMSRERVTPFLERYRGKFEFRNDFYILDVYDTPGFGSSDPYEFIKDNIDCEIRNKMQIDFVFLFLRLDRKDPSLSVQIDQILKLLRKYGLEEKNLKIYLTHSDIYSDEVINNFIVSLRNDFLIEFKNVEIERKCFANLDEIDDKFKSGYEILLADSIDSTMNDISNDVIPFDPNVLIQKMSACYVDCLNIKSNTFWSRKYNCDEECKEYKDIKLNPNNQCKAIEDLKKNTKIIFKK